MPVGEATSEPLIVEWVATILGGGHARLLMHGRTFCGKTHNAYAAGRRLLLAGYPTDQIASTGLWIWVGSTGPVSSMAGRL